MSYRGREVAGDWNGVSGIENGCSNPSKRRDGNHSVFEAPPSSVPTENKPSGGPEVAREATGSLRAEVERLLRRVRRFASVR